MSHCIIVVPCYNEADRLDLQAFESFAKQGHPQQFLFVNDGSTDDTRQVLETLHDCDPQRFALYDLPKNMGKAEAVRRGVLRALESRPDFVGFWDADLATPLSTIPEFCELLQRHGELQMVLGSRVRLLGRKIERRPLRHYLGRVFATLASLILGLPIYDTQCGAKLFRVSAELRRLFERPFRTNWIFDVELLARFLGARNSSRRQSAREAIFEVPIRQWRDVAGSKVRARDFVKALFELGLVYWTCLRPDCPDCPDSTASTPAEPIILPVPLRRKAV